LNDFLTKGVSQDNAPLQSTEVDAQGKIKMELLSLKPEPFMGLAGLKLEQYTAQIKVHPQELGPITAKIEVNDGVTTITFLTDHAHVKQLMESNLPELRQAFEQSHLHLNTVDIHHGGSQEKKEQPTYLNREDEDNLDEKPEIKGRKSNDSHDIKTNRSIIDTYA
jgi:flagellar hook-length control protein FliK